MHNTLCASEYALLKQDTLKPRPNYWAALILNKLMGIKVYEARIITNGLNVFVHYLKIDSEGFAVHVVNPNNTEKSIAIPASAEKYLLTAGGNNLLTKMVK